MQGIFEQHEKWHRVSKNMNCTRLGFRKILKFSSFHGLKWNALVPEYKPPTGFCLCIGVIISKECMKRWKKGR